MFIQRYTGSGCAEGSTCALQSIGNETNRATISRFGIGKAWDIAQCGDSDIGDVRGQCLLPPAKVTQTKRYRRKHSALACTGSVRMPGGTKSMGLISVMGFWLISNDHLNLVIAIC